MSTTTADPVERLLDSADQGRTIIKNPNVLRHDYIPERILHRDKQQELVTQSLIPLYKKSIPPNLLVYGKPGTGKTLVIKKVLNQIQNRVDKNSYRIKIVITNAKEQSNLYNVLVDLGRQLGLKPKKTPDDKLWVPNTGLSISEVFNRILYIIEKNKINSVFVIDEIDHLAKLVDKTGKDILYSITRANLKLKNGSLSLIGISNDVRFKEELDPKKHFMPSEVAFYLKKNGFDTSKIPVHVFESLTNGKEQTFTGSVQELEGKEFSDLSVMVISQTRSESYISF